MFWLEVSWSFIGFTKHELPVDPFVSTLDPWSGGAVVEAVRRKAQALHH